MAQKYSAQRFIENLERTIELTADMADKQLQRQLTYDAITKRLGQLANLGILSVIFLTPLMTCKDMSDIIKKNYVLENSLRLEGKVSDYQPSEMSRTPD